MKRVSWKPDAELVRVIEIPLVGRFKVAPPQKSESFSRERLEEEISKRFAAACKDSQLAKTYREGAETFAKTIASIRKDLDAYARLTAAEQDPTVRQTMEETVQELETELADVTERYEEYDAYAMLYAQKALANRTLLKPPRSRKRVS